MANVRNMGSVATLGTKSIVENGTYNASADNLDGYSQVTVNVPEKTLGTKSIVTNGTYNASADNLDGYSQVTVNVPEKTLGTKSIVTNGTYNASADNLDGYSQVTVNVPEVVNKMIPYASRSYSGWYIGSQTFKLDPEDPTAICLSFPVQAGHSYIMLSGTTQPFNRYRCGFASADLVANPVETALSNYFEPTDLGYTSRYVAINSVVSDGYLIAYIGLANPDNGLIAYLVDVTGVDMDGSIT